jgi:hypothetical protein
MLAILSSLHDVRGGLRVTGQTGLLTPGLGKIDQRLSIEQDARGGLETSHL